MGASASFYTKSTKDMKFWQNHIVGGVPFESESIPFIDSYKKTHTCLVNYRNNQLPYIYLVKKKTAENPKVWLDPKLELIYSWKWLQIKKKLIALLQKKFTMYAVLIGERCVNPSEWSVINVNLNHKCIFICNCIVDNT